MGSMGSMVTRRSHVRRESDMLISFVHTPMPTVALPEAKGFWEGFDRQYFPAHPGLHPLEGDVMWELPYWAHQFGGILQEQGFPNSRMLNFYGQGKALSSDSEINIGVVEQAVRENGESQVYLFSPMTANYGLARQIADVIKREYPDAFTVFGGVMATPMHRELVRDPAVDFVVRGAGDYALPQLLRSIERGEPELDRVGNLTYLDRQGVVRTSEVDHPRGIDPAVMPMPKVDLFDGMEGKGLRYLRVVHALGCLSSCDFCTISTIGRRPEYFPVDRVVAEIKAFQDYYGPAIAQDYRHTIYFGDETFTEDPAKTLALLSELKANDIAFDAQTRLDRLRDPELIDALADSGCRWLEIGLESANPDDRRSIKKGPSMSTAEQNAILQRLSDAGVATCAFTITGIPGQTAEEMARNIDGMTAMIDDGRLRATYSAVMVPYPGSRLYARPENFDLTIQHRDYARYHEDLEPVFATPQAPDPEQVHQVYLEGLVQLGEAMRTSPYADRSDAAHFGNSWDGGHS